MSGAQQLIDACRNAAETFDWESLIGPALAFAGVFATVLYGIRSTRQTLRANILTTYRLKWLDHFRADLPPLLVLGESRYTGLSEQEATEKEMRLIAKRLILLMGRENELRLEFAEVVRRFTDAPTAELADQLEILAQKIFRERWNQVRTETGEPARDKPLLSRPRSQEAAGLIAG